MSAEATTSRPPRRRSSDRVLLSVAATAVVAGGACALAALSAPSDGRTLVASYGGATAVLLCVAVAVAAYALASARRLSGRVTLMDADASRLIDHTLPALVDRLRDGASADTALAEVETPEVDAYQRVLWTLAHEVSRRERVRAAAMAACANAAGRMQALATSMLADLRKMEERHREEVLGDLLHLDHSTAQAGRLADSIAVLTGARSGRRWTKSIVMESILRGAAGRISAYQRVRVHSVSAVAVVGYAAEGVMHALAELMDNATSFSPPSEQVHVYVEEVQAGVVVTIEDCGLVMGDLALRKAERAVSSEPLDLTTLSGTRLGLAVVGVLARKYNLTVSFRPSSRGGTGVVVLIPRQLISQPQTTDQGPADDFVPPPADPPPSHVQSRREAEPARSAVGSPAPAASARSDGLSTPVGGPPSEAATAHDQNTDVPDLPKRPRGQTLAAAAAAATRAAPTLARSRADVGSRFVAFRRAVREGGTEDGADSPVDDDTT